MRSIFLLVMAVSFLQNGYSQSKIVFSRSLGALNIGGTPDLMIFDLASKETNLLFKGSVRGRGEYSASISLDKSKIIVNTYNFSGWKLGIADYNNGEIVKFKRFTSRTNYEYSAKWSHDGNYVEYQEFNWNTEDTEIFIVDKFGGNPKQITKSAGGDRTPVWSRDDQAIIFTSGRVNAYDIYLKTFVNGNIVNLSKNPFSNDFAPSTSTKENSIAFLSDREGSVNLYLMNYEGKGLVNSTSQLKTDKNDYNRFENTGYWAYQTSWSDDGNFIVFNLMVDSNLELFSIKKDETELTRITNNSDSDFSPTWLN